MRGVRGARLWLARSTHERARHVRTVAALISVARASRVTTFELETARHLLQQRDWIAIVATCQPLNQQQSSHEDDARLRALIAVRDPIDAVRRYDCTANVSGLDVDFQRSHFLANDAAAAANGYGVSAFRYRGHAVPMPPSVSVWALG